MAEDYANKADELAKKAVDQSFEDNEAGDILEPSPEVQNHMANADSDGDTDGD